MLIEIDCPCGASFEIDEDELTDEIECPACRELITVSDPEPDPDEGDGDIFEAAWQVETGEDDETSLIHEVGAALRYPFQGGGPYVLLSGWLLGAVFYWACRFSFFPAFVVFGWIGLFFLASYLLTFLEAVTLEAAGGGKRFPDWPDAGEFTSDITGPVVQFAIVAGASGLPYLAVMGVLELAGVRWWLDPVIDHLVHDGLALLWAFLAPIAYLTAVLLGPWHAFNYAHILRSIARTAASYILCFLVVLFLIWSCVAIGLALEQIPFLGWCLSSLLWLYLWVVLARLLGVYYYTSRWRLDWLRSK